MNGRGLWLADYATGFIHQEPGQVFKFVLSMLPRDPLSHLLLKD